MRGKNEAAAGHVGKESAADREWFAPRASHDQPIESFTAWSASRAKVGASAQDGSCSLTPSR